MKAKVLFRCQDKFTKEIYIEGDIINVSEARFDEINSTNLGPALAQIIEEETEKPKEKGGKK